MHELMILLGLLLSFVVGIALLLVVSTRFHRLEYLFLAFPLGIGTQTFLMSLLDWMTINITRFSVGISSLLLLALFGLILARKLKNDADFWNRISLKGYKLPKPNYAWLILMGILVWFESMNFFKTVYFPTFDTDSIRGFDFVGRTIAIEGTLKGLSLFNDPNYSFQGNAGLSSYTPFAQLAYTYAYLFGAAASKIINALMYLSFLGMFYALLKRVTTHTAAALFTLLMMITPEMLAFSGLSGINVLHSVFASTGLLYAVLWFYQKDSKLLALSAILLSLNCFTRNEGIVFSAVAFALVFFRIFTKDINWKQVLLFGFAAFFGFIYWQLFLKLNSIHSGGDLLIYKPFWDAEKFATIVRELRLLYFDSMYYGLSVVAFCVLLGLNLWNLFRKGDQAALVFAVLGVMFIYTLLIYQIDYVWDSIENVLRYSYKRFFFSFIPLLWFYIATNHIVLWTTKKADKLLYGL